MSKIEIAIKACKINIKYDIICLYYDLDVIIIKIFRRITAALLIISAVVCCGILNIMGGYALIVNNYQTEGTFLIASSCILIPVAILTITSKTTLIPMLFDIIGTGCYLYTINVLCTIQNLDVSGNGIQKLLNNHLPTVSVTILIFVMAVLNYISEEKTSQRHARKELKLKNENRELTESEKII